MLEMNKLKVHVQSASSETLGDAPCGNTTDRITYIPGLVTCLICKKKSEYRQLIDNFGSAQKTEFKSGAKPGEYVRTQKVGLKISLSSGESPSVAFYEKDIAEITLDGRREFLTVLTEHGLNIYNMNHVVSIAISVAIDEQGMCSGFGA